MKKAFAILTAAALLLCCAACAANAPAASSVSSSASAEPVIEKAWRFDVQTETYLDEYKTQDGVLLCTGRYEYPVLRLLDDGGNPYDGQGDPPPEELLNACAAFNDCYQEQSYAESFNALKEIALMDHKANSSFFPLEEQQNVVSVYQTDVFLCAECEYYTYTGGAHGIASRGAVLFDLGRGETVEWSRLTDDPEALERRLTDEVISVIRQEGMEEALFPDYASAARDLLSATVIFGEQGAYVTYSEYSIGPYAAGMPGFSVEYEKFDDLLNDYGRALLGRP